jgi:hypothetical protein
MSVVEVQRETPVDDDDDDDGFGWLSTTTNGPRRAASFGIPVELQSDGTR